jgi:hypothetical protein
MSDHDAAPDPIDKACMEAEAMLSDEAARAARRARVLAAVAREPVSAPEPGLPSPRRSAWRRGGWLAAAGVAGFGLFLATLVYRPIMRQPPSEPAAPAAPASATSTPADRGIAASPAPAGGAPSSTQAPTPRTFAAASPAAKPSPRDIEIAAQPPRPALQLAPASPAFPAAEAAPPPLPAPALAASDRPAPAPMAKSEASAGLLLDPAAGLRAATGAGRIADVKALLAKGAPVDAPDADGDTALMKSIQADHPAAAALLRRHGASLERTNHAGERARDMATAIGDAELDQALGLGP